MPLACSNRPLVQLIAPQREVHHISGGEPRVVASRRDRRAPPMGGVRRERRGGGHRRGWRDDWSCRGRAGRRLGGGVRASRRCCCSSRILSYIFRGAILSESVGALPFRFFMGRTFGAPRRLQISYVGISTYGKDHGKDMGAPSCTKKLPISRAIIQRANDQNTKSNTK